MIKAMISDEVGNRIFIIGLSFANLKKFREEPLDTFIRIDKNESGVGCDIMVISGETEDDMANLLKQMIGTND